jgi:uncharacterized protein (TIGR01777 family)
MATVLITGGTGMIGRALTKALLGKGYEVIILTRSPSGKSNEHPRLSYAGWDISRQEIDKTAIAKSDFIIHLAGAAVAEKRWTEKRKKEIVESRIAGSELLVKALKENQNKVKAIVSASAIGWYGEDPQLPNPKPFSETDPPSEDFLGTTCRQWEEAIGQANALEKRLVILRTGIVFSPEGGALDEFRKPLRFGIAPILSNGRQFMSWIQIEDLVRMYIYAMENEDLSGIYNAVAPFPVSNKTLVMQFAKMVRGKFFIPVYVPSFFLEMILGEMSIEVLKSATVSCEKIKKKGFVFQYPSLTAALQSF